MGTVRIFPAPVSGVRLADAVTVFLGTIPAANTRRGYGVVLNRLVADFGADNHVALLDREPDRVGGWFTFVWGSKGGHDVQRPVGGAPVGRPLLPPVLWLTCCTSPRHAPRRC